MPVLGLTEHPHYPSDRYDYFVGIIWSILAAAGLLQLWSLGTLRRAMPGVVVLILFILGTLSYRQSGIWQNSVALHEHMIAELGTSPHRIVLYLRLGKVNWKLGQDEKAADCFRQVLRMNPNVPEAHWHLALILQKQGKLDEAVSHYREAVRMDPRDSSSFNNLGAALAAQGKFEEAVTQLSEAVRLEPGSANARRNLARALAKLGRVQESEAQEREAERLENQRKSATP